MRSASRALRAVLVACAMLVLGATSPAARAADPPLRVLTIERNPYVFVDAGAPSRGFTIELWREIARRLDRPFEFRLETRFGDMLERLRAGEADVVAANVSITAERELWLDFSQPIFDSGLRILTPAGSDSPGLWQAIWSSGVLKLVAAAFGILLVAAHLMWLFERGAQPYFRRPYLAGVWDTFWWAFVIVTMGGFERERPERPLARVFAVLWIVAGLFFVSAFTAKITSALTVGELSDSIRDWRDLGGKRVGIATGTTMERFAQANGLAYQPFADFSEALRSLEARKLDAVIGDAAVAAYYAKTQGRGRVKLSGPLFAPDKIGIAVAQGSPLREAIDRALLRIVEDGTYAQIREKYFAAR
ncbi:MAG: transporter substrate-binding domain-containing protein [Burkholderiaceae bacterium]